ncbi:LacI family DNA-binding transcriptional regulator [Allorhizobium terrae]|uniref:LacI family DNA-binding transcriptional regulator n=1 Tax=Allorhizobium terrae TaxID=1848972 RepID=A0A4V3W7R7_9HYPH|nr:LacI family DNA-binding transcriptional regulator [Allorhizobium terrae]THF48350.1 LacI family DNA-binding transcriptional regulator [Allorhizobium terrae]
MVTLREIAKAVGVSSGTVSRVLNYDQTLSISESKRQAIIETAEALNYETPRSRNRRSNPYGLAPSPSGARAPIAIVHFLEPEDELADPYYVGVRLGIERRCNEHQLEIIKVLRTQDLKESKVLQSAGGMIVIGKHSLATMEDLIQSSRPIVFADINPRLDDYDCVLSDLGTATTKILNGLASAGYQHIGFIGSYGHLDQNAAVQSGRCEAYMDWHKTRGTFDPRLMAPGYQQNTDSRSLRLETGYEQTQLLLKLDPKPDVILCANDNMAIGAYRAIQEAGLAIPNDIALASFNDIPVTQFLNPPLSSMHIPGEHIGETAVDLLVERLSGRDYTKHVIIPTKMQWRGSCRPPVVAET